MIERIFSILKERNISPSQFAEEIGIPRSSMSHLVSGRNKPSLELVMKVLNRFPEVEPEWLLFGKASTGKVAGEKLREERTEPEAKADNGYTATAELNLFDQPEPAMEQPGPQPENVKQVDNDLVKALKKPASRQEKTPGKPDEQKTVEKILVFYTDKTFRQYLPEKE
jgi:transcriptional regulator with XRE-family HTH domain